MTTDLATIEAALAAATPGPWEEGDCWVYTMPVYPDDNRLMSVLGVRYADDERNAAEGQRAQRNAHLIALLRNTAAELVERLRTAEAEQVCPHGQTATELCNTYPSMREVEETRARAETAEATIARVRELAARFDGFAKFAVSVPDSELYAAIATALLNAIDANQTGVITATDPASGPETASGASEVVSGGSVDPRGAAGHDGDHEDGHGVTWTGGER